MLHSTNTSIIREDYNEHSSDSNPYAYPYFHADGTAPAIYQIINTYFGSSPEGESPADGASVQLNRTRTNRRGELAKGIQSQCLACPSDASWTDSCGENALHRLCQLVKFSLHERIHGVPFTNRINYRTSKTLTPAELYLYAQRFLLEADSEAAQTMNNWGETPLSQFLSHCGFASNPTDDIDEICEILDEGTPFKLHFGCRGPIAMPADKDMGKKILPMLKFLDALLEANPKSISTTNYLQALPLHEACTLSQVSNSPADLSAPMDAIVNFSVEENELEVLRKKKNMRLKGHSLVVKKLVDHYPKALMKVDNMGRIPLCRAIQSMHCGTDIVEILLEEMEIFLRLKTRMNAGEDKSLSLLRMVIMGQSNPYVETDACFKDKQLQNIRSPIEELWKVLLTARQILEPLSCEKNQRVASISRIIESKLDAYKRCASIDRQTHRQHQIREQKVAFLLAKQIVDIWDKAVILILASYRGTAQGIQNSMKEKGIIHAAAFCAVPRCMLNMAVRMYPDELTEKDENGDTPLSILLSRHKPCKSMYGWGRSDDIREQDVREIESMDIIQTVLWADPDAAALPSSNGRLPLHLAIDQGLHWIDGIQDIFMAYPNAVSIRDPITRLFPFMHASMKHSDAQLDTCTQKGNPRSEDELQVSLEPDHILTTAYELLRSNPANLNGIRL